MANLTTIFNENVGWRNSYLIVSCIGTICALLGLTIEEAIRTNDRGKQLELELK